MEAPDFFVEELLDFPNGDETMADAFFDGSTAGNSTDSSTVTAVDSCNSSVSGGADNSLLSDLPIRSFADAHFSGELCVPYDDAAELEWLSNFVEESFSTDDLHKLHLISGAGVAQPQPRHHHHHHNPVPGKARSKLARIAPSNWSTRLLASSSTSAHHHHVGPAAGSQPKKPARKRAESSDGPANGEVRRCLHCATEKTPQWRTGPMGPKTLCNACGVRYKSGRLVPEYRPAASPTFVSTKHSNSHRKVLELRRQKEIQRHQHRQQFVEHGAVAGVFAGAGGEDYLVHHHVGSGFRQLM